MKSLLLEYNVCDDMKFILPKSLHLCMIRFVHNTSARGREGASIGEEEEQQSEELKEHIFCEGAEGGMRTPWQQHVPRQQGRHIESWSATRTP